MGDIATSLCGDDTVSAHDGVGDALEAGGHGGDVEPVRHPRVGARLPPQPPAGQRGAAAADAAQLAAILQHSLYRGVATILH